MWAFVIGLLMAVVWLPIGVGVRLGGLSGATAIGKSTPSRRLLRPAVLIGDLLNAGTFYLAVIIGLAPAVSAVVAGVVLLTGGGHAGIWGLLIGSLIGLAAVVPYELGVIFTAGDPLDELRPRRSTTGPRPTPATETPPGAPTAHRGGSGLPPGRIVLDRPGIDIAYVHGSYRSAAGGRLIDGDDRATFTALVVPVERVAALEESTEAAIAATAHVPDSMYVTFELLEVVWDNGIEAIVVTAEDAAQDLSDAERQRADCYRALLVALAAAGVGAIVIAEDAGPGRRTHDELTGGAITLRDNEIRPFPILRLVEATAWLLRTERTGPRRSRPRQRSPRRTRTITVPRGPIRAP